MFKKTILISSLLLASSSYAANFAASTAGGALTSNITMNVISSCSATSNDVVFGSQSATAISAGITAKLLEVQITCDSVLPKYTLRLDATHGVNNATNGTIKTSSNTTILYQFTWGDATFGTKDGYITTWATALAPKTLPTATTFKIPIYVKPLKNGTSIKPGAANTSVKITLAFN